MPQRIAGTMTANEATTAKAMAECRLPSVDFQVPIPDWWLSVIERILVKPEIANCQSVAIRLATGLLRGKERVGSYFRIGSILISQWRQSTDVSSRVWYRAEVSVTTHYAAFSGPKSSCARLRDSTRRYRKCVNAKYSRGIDAGLLDDREVIAALGAAAQHSVG